MAWHDEPEFPQDLDRILGNPAEASDVLREDDLWVPESWARQAAVRFLDILAHGQEASVAEHIRAHGELLAALIRQYGHETLRLAFSRLHAIYYDSEAHHRAMLLPQVAAQAADGQTADEQTRDGSDAKIDDTYDGDESDGELDDGDIAEWPPYDKEKWTDLPPLEWLGIILAHFMIEEGYRAARRKMERRGTSDGAR